ncbi:MAG: hypothetical protein EBY44_00945 [Actinobacteria bacterium]|nr:hypothetical protein [Actinomycetota bacterium]
MGLGWFRSQLLHQHSGAGDVRASVRCPVPASHVDLSPPGAADRALRHTRCQGGSLRADRRLGARLLVRFFTRYEISGPGAADFLDRVICTRLPGTGRVRLSYLLRPNGTVWSEATIGRDADDHFLWLGPTAARERDFDWLQQHLPDDGSVELRLGTERTSTLMVMGPNSRALLSRLTNADLSASAAPWMSLREIEIAGVMATALRVSFVGELGWELHVDDADLIELYEALWSVGADLGLRDFGSYALNSMRVEKGYHGWGSECRSCDGRSATRLELRRVDDRPLVDARSGRRPTSVSSDPRPW